MAAAVPASGPHAENTPTGTARNPFSGGTPGVSGGGGRAGGEPSGSDRGRGVSPPGHAAGRKAEPPGLAARYETEVGARADRSPLVARRNHSDPGILYPPPDGRTLAAPGSQKKAPI